LLVVTVALSGNAAGQIRVAGRPARAALPASAACEHCGKDGGSCSCHPHWHVAADFVWMGRSRADQQTIIRAPLGGGAPTESVNVYDLLFEVNGGVRGNVAYDGDNGYGWEVGYLGVFNQPAMSEVSDTDMFFDFFGRQPAVATNAYTVNYESSLHSTEVNWRLCERWRVRPLIGVRWIRHAENFSILDTADVSEDAFADMSNDLFGGQAGLTTVLWDRGGWFRVEGGVKAGLYHDRMRLRARVLDQLGVQQAGFSQAASSTAFSGEIVLSAVWQFSANASFRVGYQGLWLTNIGLAPDQSDNFTLAGVGSVETNDISYQGGHLGLEVRW